MQMSIYGITSDQYISKNVIVDLYRAQKYEAYSRTFQDTFEHYYSYQLRNDH